MTDESKDALRAILFTAADLSTRAEELERLGGTAKIGQLIEFIEKQDELIHIFRVWGKAAAADGGFRTLFQHLRQCPRCDEHDIDNGDETFCAECGEPQNDLVLALADEPIGICGDCFEKIKAAGTLVEIKCGCWVPPDVTEEEHECRQ